MKKEDKKIEDTEEYKQLRMAKGGVRRLPLVNKMIEENEMEIIITHVYSKKR